MKKRSPASGSPRVLLLFMMVALGWGVLGALMVYFLSSGDWSSLRYFGIFWLLSAINLAALTQTLSAVFELLAMQEGSGSASSEKKAAITVQAFVWGTLKLACLGIFGLVLYRSSNAPLVSLLLGTGTLVVVSLVGGWIWSQRVVRNA